MKKEDVQRDSIHSPDAYRVLPAAAMFEEQSSPALGVATNQLSGALSAASGTPEENERRLILGALERDGVYMGLAGQPSSSPSNRLRCIRD